MSICARQAIVVRRCRSVSRDKLFIKGGCAIMPVPDLMTGVLQLCVACLHVAAARYYGAE